MDLQDARGHGATLQGLEGRALQNIFVVYGTLFMRLTRAVSRQQEFLADQTAARVAGAAHVARSLQKAPAVEAAFNGYWSRKSCPCSRRDSFHLSLPVSRHSCHRTPSSVAAARFSAAARTEGKAGEFDTHPSLAERLAALGISVEIPAGTVDTSASGLLGDAEEMTWELLKRSAGQEAVERLRPVEWSDVGRVVYVANWRQAVGANALSLSRFRSDDLPIGVEAYVGVGAQIVPPASRDEKVRRAVGLLGMGLGSPSSTPGGNSTTALAGRSSSSIVGAQRNASLPLRWCTRYVTGLWVPRPGASGARSRGSRGSNSARAPPHRGSPQRENGQTAKAA